MADCLRLQKGEPLAANAEDRLQAFYSQAGEACSSQHSMCPHKFLSGTGTSGSGRQVQIPTALQKSMSQVIENSRPVKTDKVCSMQEMLIDKSRLASFLQTLKQENNQATAFSPRSPAASRAADLTREGNSCQAAPGLLSPQ